MRVRDPLRFLMLVTGGLLCAACGSESDPLCEDGARRCAQDRIEICAGGAWSVEQDCAAEGATCVEEDGDFTCYTPGPFDGLQIVLDLGSGGSRTVELGELECTEYEGQPAIRLIRVVEQGGLELPWDHQYNFVSSDGFDVLVDRYEGDPAVLPFYGELEHGFLAWTEEDGLRVFWDDEVDMPGALGVKQMQGGTIATIPFGASEILLVAGQVRTRIDISALATEEVVDYKHPEDGARPMVPMATFFEAGELDTADAFDYKFYGNDGFTNIDTNLMPYENTSHSWIEPVDRKVVSEEAWDTQVCCWRVRDTVIVQGIPVE
ncbi:MAG: hypothetical protein JXR96_15060 [Deltaproteobacteria bacterium]|nr:hypothetical protein [Deltaproteobacteria bacterium]